MNRAKMIWIALQYRFQCAYDFLRPRLGSAVDVPQAPRMQIHRRLGKKCGGVQVSEFANNFPHGFVIILGSFFQIGVRINGKPFSKRADYACSLAEEIADSSTAFCTASCALLNRSGSAGSL